MLNKDLELTLNLAFRFARERRHEYMTVEHLLLALLDNPAAGDALRSCGANIEKLRLELASFIDSTTPVLPVAAQAAMHCMQQGFGNPSSSHATGIKAKAELEATRALARRLIGASSGEIIFTSGATEGIQTGTVVYLLAKGEAYALRLDVEKALSLIGKELSWEDAARGEFIATPAIFGDVVLARKDLPAANGDELVAYARKTAAEGKPLTYASVGPGSLYHLLGEHLSKVTGLPMTHVAYKGGAPAVQDLMGGQVDIFMTPYGKGQVQLVEDGKLDEWVSFYEDVMGFGQLRHFDESQISRCRQPGQFCAFDRCIEIATQHRLARAGDVCCPHHEIEVGRACYKYH